MKNYKNTKWKDNDIKFLTDNYTHNGVQFCSDKLNRSNNSIRRKVRALKLKTYTYKVKYMKNNLTNTINESYTISEVLDKLNMRCAGGNFKTIKKYIELYKIDISHFISDEIRIEKLKNTGYSNKLMYDQLFVENCKHSRGTLKNHIIKNELFPYVCILCKQDENWMGKQMSLILDHINGVHNDNRIENLRFVCPNCNSTLNTHCGKNKSKNKKPDKRKLNKEKYDNEQKKYIKLVENSDIVFSKHGWSGKVAEIINQKPQKVKIWMKRFMLDFYDKECFKRKIK